MKHWEWLVAQDAKRAYPVASDDYPDRFIPPFDMPEAPERVCQGRLVNVYIRRGAKGWVAVGKVCRLCGAVGVHLPTIRKPPPGL
jgi:hypothetical protein